jgi:hypothetical protein
VTAYLEQLLAGHCHVGILLVLEDIRPQILSAIRAHEPPLAPKPPPPLAPKPPLFAPVPRPLGAPRNDIVVGIFGAVGSDVTSFRGQNF